MQDFVVLEYSYWWATWMACGVILLVLGIVAAARRNSHILGYSFLAMADGIVLSIFGWMTTGTPSFAGSLVLAVGLIVGNLLFLLLLQKTRMALNVVLVRMLSKTETARAAGKNSLWKKRDSVRRGRNEDEKARDVEGGELEKMQQEELILKKADMLLSTGDYEQAANLLELLCIQTESEWCKKCAYERLVFLKGERE